MTIHPAFPYPPEVLPDWMHPNAWTLLHPVLQGVMVSLSAEDMDALARHIFDDLGAVLPNREPVTEPIQIDLKKPGERYRLELPLGAGTTTRITQGSLPPGLELSGNVISGIAEQSGSWIFTAHYGPQIRYQAPPTGPVGTYNPGKWQDFSVPWVAPVVAVDISDLPDDQVDELERMIAARRAAERSE